MPQQLDHPLRDLMARAGNLSGRALHGVNDSVALGDLVSGSSLDFPTDALAGSAVLVATTDQLNAALAVIELDGVARRLVLCPPDVQDAHLPLIIAAAEIDTVVTDGKRDVTADSVRFIQCTARLSPAASRAAGNRRTEWILLTSGTTGLPKLVVHSLASLSGAIKPPGAASDATPVWSTFYDIRRYGGLQIFLRAVLGTGSLVLSSPHETTAEFLARAGSHGTTRISGTPSHWRRALMNPAANRIAPQYVRLSGEIADQAILDDLRAFYRNASVGHAFASTEAGVAFEVDDGLAGFPASLIGRLGDEVEMKIDEDSLRIRSRRTASHYLGDGVAPLRDDEGFVDTGDVVDRRADRYYFVGRRGGVINVGGLKVHPEEVEAVINSHPAVQMSLVRAHKNPFTGAVVVADVVVRSDPNSHACDAAVAAQQSEIMAACRRFLPSHKVPAAIRFVPSLNVGAAGKMARSNA